MHVYVVRHGQTAWNVDGLLQGVADVPLTDAGHAQAAATAAALREFLGGDVRIATSPLQRARHTAEAIAGALDVDIVIDERLRERAYGVWEGISADERERDWPDEVARWRTHGTAEVPGFEHHDAVRERMVAALEHHADSADETLVIVTHGSAARVGLQGVLGLPLDHRTLGNLGNAAWSRLTRRGPGDWTLERHNVTPELLGDAAPAAEGAA